ncbi:CopG family transcriptional regulator [Lampropedia cohaerens]|uniref:CopG family transcriptional regulator n=1 Tax=Lampropedia cohaerens TaxID=1610491 RepID=A0A0U1PY51_9BURK|nr:type II toxin-antitoxin system HicB family antitoxin [Lampropedia cohaerens]KKW67386.1 CopG family transcriptional regulator [Lampropedia cohaerens]
MLYPVYVHKDQESAYGAIFPDIPGCFAAADTLDDLPRAAQEAFEAHFGADDDPIPAPSSPERWRNAPDYQGGFWLLVDLDPSKIRSRAVRLNISLPENLVARIDATARELGQSRSAFLAQAAEKAIQQRI